MSSTLPAHEKRRWPWRAVSIGLALVVLLVAALAAFLVFGPRLIDDERLARWLEPRLDEALAGEVKLGQVSWEGGGAFVITDLVIRDARGEEVARVGAARLRVGIGALLSRSFTVEELVLRDVVLVAHEDGPWAERLLLLDALRSPAPPPGSEGPKKRDEPWAVRLSDVSAAPVRLVDRAGRALVPPLHLELERLAYHPQRGLTLESARLSHEDAELAGSLVLRRQGDQLVLAEGEGALRFSLANQAFHALLPPAVQEVVGPRGRVELTARGRDAAGGELTAHLSARGQALVVRGVPVSAASVEARLGGGELTIDAIDAELDGGRIAGAARWSLSAATPWPLTARLHLEAAPLGKVVPEARLGALLTASGDLQLRREDGHLVLRGELRGAGLPRPLAALGEPLEVSGTLRLAAGRPHLAEGELTVRAPLGQATFTGELPFTTTAPLSGDVSAHAGPELARRLELPVTLADVELRGSVNGTWSAPTAAVRVLATEVRHPRLPPARVELALAVTSRTVLLREAVVSSPAGTVRLAGRVDLPEAGAALTEAKLDLQGDGELHLRALSPDLDGALRLRGRAGGAVGAPVVHLEGSGADVHVAGVPLAAVSTTLDVADGRARLVARSKVLGGEVRADVQLGNERDLAGTVRLADLHLAALAELLPAELALGGDADAVLTLGGSLAAPRLEADLDVRGFSVLGLPLGVLRGQSNLVGETLSADLELVGPSGRGAVRGTLALGERTVEGGLALEDVRLGLLGERLGFADLTGVGRLEVAVRGALARPALLVASGELSRLRRGGAPLPSPLSFEVRSADGAYEVVASVPNALALRGTVHLNAAPRVHLALNFADVAFSPFVPRLAQAGVEVLASGYAIAEYDAANGWRGHGEVQEAAAGVSGEELVLVRPAPWTWRDDSLHLGDLELASTAGASFTAEGSIGADLDLVVQGELLAGVIVPFVPALAYADGKLQVDLRAEGRLDEPRLSGRLTVEDRLRLRPRALAREIIVNAADLVLSSGAGGPGEVRGFVEGSIDGGDFRLDGEVGLRELRPVRFAVSLSGRGLPLRWQSLSLELDGDLRLIGDRSAMRLLGRVDVARGRYLKAFELREFNFVAREPTRASAPPPAWFERVALDIKVTSAAALDLRVDAGVLEMDLLLDADIDVGGTAANPTLDGRVEVARGHVDFPAARLEVTRGSVELRPRARGFSATVQLRAEGEVEPDTAGDGLTPTYFVVLEVLGDLDELAVELRSSPDVSRLEVLALLVTGQASLESLAATGDGGDGVGLDTALLLAGSQLTAPITDFLEEQVEAALNLRLQLGAEVTSEGLRLTAQQDVSRRLLLEGAYEQVIGGGSLASVRARLLLTDRLFLEGTRRAVTNDAVDVLGIESESRVELKWRLYGT